MMRWKIALPLVAVLTAALAVGLIWNKAPEKAWSSDTGAGSVQAFAIPTFNVKDYGAVGDGVTNDTASIAKAVKAAQVSGGGTIYFDRGTYLINSIHIPENISVLGAGRGEATLIRNDNKDEAALRLLGNQSVQGIGIKARIGIMPNGDDINIIDVRFECSVQGIQNAVTVNRLTVFNSLFENSGYGILSNINPSYEVKILNTRFVNIKGDGIEINAPSRDWVIENCVFDTNTSASRWAGFGVGVALSAKDIVIKNSSFIHIRGQGVHVEDYAEVTIVNSIFKNNGSANYTGDPKADIAVLSNAKVKVYNSKFMASTVGYSKLAIYNTDLPVGGTITVYNSQFQSKTVSKQVTTVNSIFLP